MFKDCENCAGEVKSPGGLKIITENNKIECMEGGNGANDPCL